MVADEINEGAAEGDRVGGETLRGRVRNAETGRPDKRRNPPNNYPQTKDEPQQPTYEQLKKYSETSGPLYFADLAILQLGRISDDDPTAKEALGNVIEWCHQKLTKVEG